MLLHSPNENSKLRLLQAMIVFVFVSVVGVSRANAQSSQISGQVVDQQSAALSGAKLTISRVETGERRQAISSSQGYYSFPLLPPGQYDLVTERDGFEAQQQTGIVVVTGNITTVNVTLKVGDVTQTVSVQASGPLLQFESSAVGKAVENQTIVDMPLLDRKASQLQRLNGFYRGERVGIRCNICDRGRKKRELQLHD